jgi:phosphoserine phosphatase
MRSILPGFSRRATFLTDSSSPIYRTVVLDVDSTLCGIEGIDWLAERRDVEIARRIADETALAMRGELTIEAIYESRLSTVAPTRAEVTVLGDAYLASIAEGAEEAISRWIRSGTVVALVSGGIRQAIAPLAQKLGIESDRVYAMDLSFDDHGAYAGYDTESPLSKMLGKRDLIAGLDLPRPILMVGDGSTDLTAKQVVDAFAAFTGFSKREEIALQADFVASSFSDVDDIVFGRV